MKANISKKRLMNCYGEEDTKFFHKISLEEAFQWLEEANRFFNKINPKRLEAERKLKEVGW